MDGDQVNGLRAVVDEDCTSSDFVMLSHQDESIAVHTAADAIDRLQLSFNSGSSDIPIEEAEGHVKDLMKENVNLRESLEKHTAILHRQYDTVQAWQKQFADTNVSLQKSLELSRAKEEALRKECEEKAASEMRYQELAEKMKQEVTAKEAELAALKDEKNQLQEAIAKITDKMNCLEKAMEHKDAENKALAERCKEAIERLDLFGSRTDRTLSGVDMSTLGPVTSFMSVSELESCAANDACGPPSIASKLAEVTVQLHNEQSKTARQSQEISALTAEVAGLTERLNKDTVCSSEMANQAKRISMLESAIVQKDFQLDKWQQENKDLQHLVEEKRTEVDCLRRALLEAEHRQAASQRDYDELLKTWQEYESSEERAFVTVESAQPVSKGVMNDKIRDLERQLCVTKKGLEEKDQQLAELRRTNEECKRQLELLPPLQAQLEVYSSDYATEKELRISAQTKVAELQEQLRQMRDEMGNRDSQEGDNERRQDVGPFQANAALGGLPCPLCTIRCATQRAYIDHVQACVEGTEPCGP